MTHPTASATPPPVLYNAWKHHAAWVRARITAAVASGPAGVDSLAAELVIVGTSLMDLYTGQLAADEVARQVLAQLEADGRLAPEPFAEWLDGQGGYGLVTLPSDASVWALRLGPAGGRYVHLHPGRHTPHTVRVNAATLKTAVLAHAVAGITGGSAFDVTVVNEARRRYLDLPPVPDLPDAPGGLRGVLTLLAGGG